MACAFTEPAVSRPRRDSARSPATLRGVALDARTLEPVAGAGIACAARLAFTAGPLSPGWHRGSQRSDLHGEFEIPAPAAARPWLLVRHARYLPEIVELARGASTVRVLLHQPASLHGSVLDADGRPLAGVAVQAISYGTVDIVSTASGRSGRFRMRGLRPGRWMVALAGTCSEPLAELTLGEGELGLVELRTDGPPAARRHTHRRSNLRLVR